jgi:nucleotide-binding universal stress UspA family protein
MTNTLPKRVVVGLDGSQGSRLGLDWAIEDAARRHRPLHLLCAWQFETAETVTPLRPSIEDECRSILDAAAAHARAGSRGLDVQTSMVHAHPAAALIEASRNADTVVVGSRGLGAVKELLIGSISMQVAVYALSPVVVVREVITQDGTPGGVVVGVDGSELSVEATGFAFEQASQRGLKLTVLHAWDPTFYTSAVALSALFDTWDDVEVGEEVVTSEAIAGWAEKYPDVEVRTQVLPGRPADTLVDASETAELVVVGSRGRGGFSGLLLGSVSRNVLHRAHCPVAVVRPSGHHHSEPHA